MSRNAADLFQVLTVVGGYDRTELRNRVFARTVHWSGKVTENIVADIADEMLHEQRPELRQERLAGVDTLETLLREMED